MSATIVGNEGNVLQELDKTQSSTDTTAGRLLKVGDFGLGRLPAVSSGSANLDVAPGFYFKGSASPNIPITTAGFLQTISGSIGTPNDRLVQIYYVYGSNTNYVRSSNDGITWNAWRKMYDQGSILGTVSQSGGVPTGAIIERGSNANGEYTKFADGTLICLAYISFTGTTTWTFSAPFTDVPAISTIDQRSADTLFIAVGSGVLSNTSASIYAWNVSSGSVALRTTALTSRLIAIGRWF